MDYLHSSVSHDFKKVFLSTTMVDPGTHDALLPRTGCTHWFVLLAHGRFPPDLEYGVRHKAVVGIYIRTGRC
jgi:hypothetical protein